MNWYSVIKHSQIRGEYWITESGQVMMADGDIGDYNHEGYAIEVAQSQLSDGDDYEGWKREVCLQLLEGMKDELEDQKMALEENVDTKPIDDKLYEIWEMKQNVDYHAYELINGNLEELGIDQDLFDLAEGHGDARKYAMEKWGWKRLEGNNVETWTLTRKDLQSIGNGLYEAYDEAVETATFNIYLHSNQKFYTDIPWAVIDSESLSEFRNFDSMMTNAHRRGLSKYAISQEKMKRWDKGIRSNHSKFISQHGDADKLLSFFGPWPHRLFIDFPWGRKDVIEGSMMVQFATKVSELCNQVNLHEQPDRLYEFVQSGEHLGSILKTDKGERGRTSQRIVSLGKFLSMVHKRYKDKDARLSSQAQKLFKYAETEFLPTYGPKARQKLQERPLVVAFTRNPYDIAAMSTFQKWTSCFGLWTEEEGEAGGHSNLIPTEIKQGGFMAYLTYKDDAQIDQPLARIWVRRVQVTIEGQKKTYYIPENATYSSYSGDLIDVFENFVAEWVEKQFPAAVELLHRGMESPGWEFPIVLRGAQYSDTFGYRGEGYAVNMISVLPKKYLDAIVGHFNTKMPKEEQAKLLKLISDRIMGGGIAYVDEFMKLPDELISPELKQYMYKTIGDELSKEKLDVTYGGQPGTVRPDFYEYSHTSEQLINNRVWEKFPYFSPNYIFGQWLKVSENNKEDMKDSNGDPFLLTMVRNLNAFKGVIDESVLNDALDFLLGLIRGGDSILINNLSNDDAKLLTEQKEFPEAVKEGYKDQLHEVSDNVVDVWFHYEKHTGYRLDDEERRKVLQKYVIKNPWTMMDPHDFGPFHYRSRAARTAEYTIGKEAIKALQDIGWSQLGQNLPDISSDHLSEFLSTVASGTVWKYIPEDLHDEIRNNILPQMYSKLLKAKGLYSAQSFLRDAWLNPGVVQQYIQEVEDTFYNSFSSFVLVEDCVMALDKVDDGINYPDHWKKAVVPASILVQSDLDEKFSTTIYETAMQELARGVNDPELFLDTVSRIGKSTGQTGKRTQNDYFMTLHPFTRHVLWKARNKLSQFLNTVLQGLKAGQGQGVWSSHSLWRLEYSVENLSGGSMSSYHSQVQEHNKNKEEEKDRSFLWQTDRKKLGLDLGEPQEEVDELV